MRHLLVSVVVGSLALGTLAAGVSLAGPKKNAFRVRNMPFEIADDGVAAKPRREADGRIHFEQKLNVKVDGEKAERPVRIKASHSDAAQGGHLHLAITEDTGHKTSQFAFTPATNTIALASETDSVAITKNPDGSYTVGGKRVANGKEAVALLRANPVYKGLAPESLLVAYAAAQTPLPEVKNTVDCNNNAGTRPATAPAVCTVFKDLCDCVACDVSSKGAACASCQ